MLCSVSGGLDAPVRGGYAWREGAEEDGMGDLGRLLLTLGVVLALCGLALIFWDRLPLGAWLAKFPLGRLPGDISIRRENFSFSFPIVTCLIISVLVSLIMALFRR
jgi:hypothetical protein